MPLNQIIKRVAVGSITKSGQEITLSVATQTSEWLRPDSIALQQGPGFKGAVEASKHLLPSGTKEVCQRSGRSLELSIYATTYRGKMDTFFGFENLGFANQIGDW